MILTDDETVVDTDAEFDDELGALAMAAEPEPALDPDAVSLWEFLRSEDRQLLPTWYMPSPMAGARRLTGRRRRVAVAVVVALLLIDAAGLCSTYGSIVLA